MSSTFPKHPVLGRASLPCYPTARKKRNVPPARDPSSAGGASINGIALDCTMDQRATRAAGATVTARPASAEGARRVAPAKEDTKPIMVDGGGEAGRKVGGGRRKEGELDEQQSAIDQRRRGGGRDVGSGGGRKMRSAAAKAARLAGQGEERCAHGEGLVGRGLGPPRWGLSPQRRPPIGQSSGRGALSASDPPAPALRAGTKRD